MPPGHRHGEGDWRPAGYQTGHWYPEPEYAEVVFPSSRQKVGLGVIPSRAPDAVVLGLFGIGLYFMLRPKRR